jgi:ankyrin repeat protein
VDVAIPEDAPPEVAANIGETPLHYAARFSNTETVKALMAAHADINHRGNDLMSPLMMAAGSAADGVVALLLASHARIDFTNDKGANALMQACLKPNEEYAREPLRVKCVKALVKAGCPVNGTDSYGNTALHYCAYNGYPQVARALMELGANPGLRNVDGQTAAQLAAARGN